MKYIILLSATLLVFTTKGISTGVVNRQSAECLSICKENITIPDCGTLKMAPSYNKACGCLIEYACCPDKCEKLEQNCTKGTFPVDDVDCCNCPIVRCDECPKVNLPNCTNSKCEDIEYEKTTLGCEVPICRTRCPELIDPDCPKCSVVETFINVSFCGCEQQRCIPKTCSIPKRLDPTDHPCRVIVNTTDDCGCAYFKPEQGPYCLPYNKKARETKCTSEKLPSKCFQNVVKEKTDECGCDTSECALKEETVENEFEDRSCPEDHHFIAGLTPCGRPRDACAKCPESKADATNCPSNCNKIEESKDFHGCSIKTCKRNPCKDCYEGGHFGPDVREDECGCKICLVLPELVFQRRRSVENTFFYKDLNQYRYNGFKSYGDFWLGLHRINRYTEASYTARYQLVFSAKRRNDGKWMQIVYDRSYVDDNSDFRIKLGSVVEKHETNISDSDARTLHNAYFSTHNHKNYRNYPKNYKGGWWWNGAHKICLNCDQRKTHLWYEAGRTVAVTETQMSVRTKIGL